MFAAETSEIKRYLTEGRQVPVISFNINQFISQQIIDQRMHYIRFETFNWIRYDYIKLIFCVNLIQLPSM